MSNFDVVMNQTLIYTDPSNKINISLVSPDLLNFEGRLNVDIPVVKMICQTNSSSYSSVSTSSSSAQILPKVMHSNPNLLTSPIIADSNVDRHILIFLHHIVARFV